MKNAAAELFFTKQIETEKPDPKIFYRFVGTFEKVLSSNEVLINSYIKMTLVKQPQEEDISTVKPKDKILVFAQIVEENKHIEGQIRKITLERALKFQNLMKKQKYKSFEKINLVGTSNKGADEEDSKKTKSTIFGQRNGGFYQHF